MQATQKIFHVALCLFRYSTLHLGVNLADLRRDGVTSIAWNELWFVPVASALLADVLALYTRCACYAQYSITRMVIIRIPSFPIIGHRKVEIKANTLPRYSPAFGRHF